MPDSPTVRDTLKALVRRQDCEQKARKKLRPLENEEEKKSRLAKNAEEKEQLRRAFHPLPTGAAEGGQDGDPPEQEISEVCV
ncbi:hypothetical protein BDK51DRAFT_47463 [Blyttiomyces helicus]|uniref:Uncharacterized protein n=1 Tax=Blyttiomyces helicus TaxID=388810 RepID=A0A4P9WH87_9FUNG|nr:hypothetical protein BDK51DRAFT_47463 [Blyttiomyces helicus]|eukprot:RKO90430.1 hypothetical protein BDK51DRAFT_47463 [Blyttiomyces helicus]